MGRDAIHERAGALLDGAPADYAFTEGGPGYVGGDHAALAWTFGPPGAPVARGLDVLTLRDGRVSHLRTLLAPAPARNA